MMLVLSRKSGEQLHIGDRVTLTVVKISGNRVRIGIEAPSQVNVVRAELSTWHEMSFDQPRPNEMVTT